MQKRNRIVYFLMSLPAAALYAVFFIMPLISGVAYSLFDWNGISRSKNFIGLANYASLFSDRKIARTATFTVEYTIVMLIGVLVLGLAIALMLNTVIRGRGFYRTMYFLPAVLSTVTVALIWNQLFTNALPQIGKQIGSKVLSSSVLGNVHLAFWAVVFTALWQGLSTNILLFLSALQNVPQDLIESAWLDGANSWQTFLHIKVPFLIPTLNIVTIMTIKGGLMAFDNIYALTGGGPARTTESVGMLIYNYAFTELKFSYSNALSIAVFAVILIFTVVQLGASKRFEVKQDG